MKDDEDLYLTAIFQALFHRPKESWMSVKTASFILRIESGWCGGSMPNTVDPTANMVLTVHAEISCVHKLVDSACIPARSIRDMQRYDIVVVHS